MQQVASYLNVANRTKHSMLQMIQSKLACFEEVRGLAKVNVRREKKQTIELMVQCGTAIVDM